MKLSFILLIVPMFCVVSQAAVKDVDKDDCHFDTKLHKGKTVFFVIEPNANPKNVKSTEVEISGNKFTLSLMKGLKTYVSYDVPSDGENVACDCPEKDVTLRYEIIEADKLKEIKLGRGESVGMVYGGKKLQLFHDKENRKHTPISVEIIDGPKTTAKVSLVIQNKKEDVYVHISKGHKNFVIVGADKMDAESFNVDVKMDPTSNVIVTNLQEDKPTIAKAETSYLTCLSDFICPIDIPTNVEALMLKFNVLQNENAEDTLIRIATPRDDLVLPKDIDTFLHLKKRDLEPELILTFGSKKTDLSNAVTIRISNLIETEYLKIEKEAINYRGGSINGVFITGPQATTFTSYKFVDTEVFMSYEKINSKAISFEDLWKKIPLNVLGKNFLFLSKEQINEIGEVRFKLETDKRVSVVLSHKPSAAFYMLPGSEGSLSKKRQGLVKQYTNSVFTLIFQPDPKLEGRSTKLQCKDEIEVGQNDVYVYMEPEDFVQQEIFFCAPKDDNVVIGYTRIENKLPFLIQPGKQMLQESSDITIKIEDPTKGVTLFIKNEKNEKSSISLSLDLNRKETNGNVMKMVRTLNGAFNEAIFIYPEDVNSADKLSGEILFEKGKKVLIEYKAGIEEIKMKTGSYIVRNYPVEFEIQKPQLDHVFIIELQEDSPADEIHFTIGEKKFKLDKKKNIIQVPLSTSFLQKNFPLKGQFNTVPSDLDAHINIQIKSSVGLCKTNPCNNGGKCIEEGDKYKCECEDGFEGEDCKIITICKNNPCLNGGRCGKDGETYKCECIKGFEGKDCGTETICKDNPCLNGGRCGKDGETYKCECIKGFEGKNCQTEISESDLCSDNPCQNGGTCKKDGQSYKCECMKGFKGDKCGQKSAAPTMLQSNLVVLLPILSLILFLN